MSRFRYARDPLCYVACTCYALNRWCLPAALKGPFSRDHFSDTLLIPAALPVVLWVQRRLGLRTADTPPTWNEIVLHLIVWSITAEVVGPRLFSRATGDVWDVVAYAAGGLIAGVFWQRP